jgi:Histidine kinase-, DNA gyrase B-, and HSP90-like ATPase
MRLTIGLEAINNYKRLSYDTWYALAEFVDNSTQAYYDNREILDAVLKKKNERFFVSVIYDRLANTITIKDNSIGMSEAEIEEAIKIASRPPRENGRSRYGMGMKTAACWFGDYWTIKTKKLGETQSITVNVDVPAVAGTQGDLLPIIEKAEPDEHYTEITISRLHRKIYGRAINNIKEYLSSIYRCDIRDGTLELLWMGTPLTWTDFDDKILQNRDGVPYKRSLEFEVLGKRVTGWVAVLQSGGRRFGGFSLLQSNRVIVGFPDAWRPRTLFGQEQGSNDLVNQRLCGELFLNGFEVNHTKDGISWQGEEEETIEKELADRCDDYRTVAGQFRKRDKRGPSQLAIDNAVDQVTKELSSGEMVDAIELTEIPPESVLKQASKKAIQQAAKSRPRIDIQVGDDMWVKVYINADTSPLEHYYALDWQPDGTIEITINQNHDYMVQLGDDVADFIRQCVYDGIAEFKATQMRGKVEPNTIRFFKDNLFRVPYKIHDDSPEREGNE